MNRSVITLPLTALALAALAGTAIAGTDSDDEDGGPVPAPTQVPIVQAPAPAPVAAPIAAPAPAAPESAVRHKATSHVARHTSTRSRPSRRTVRRTSTHAVSLRRTAAVVPRGGVQAGAGGAARRVSARPVAHAAGDPVAIVPSIVQTRIRRTENALDRLTGFVDDGDAAGVTRTGKVIRRQLAAAWRGTVYYLKNPPPPAGEDLARAGRVRLSSLPAKVRAHIADDDGPVIADPPTTMLATFQLMHEVAATMAELTDGARVPVLDAMSRTLFYTLDKRDSAIQTAHSLEPPVDPEAEGGEDAVTIGTVMPQVVPQLDDEIQQIRGLQSDATDLRPGGKAILRAGLTQALLTELTINTIWPPVGED